MVGWGNAPWALRAYAIVAMANSIVVAIIASSTPAAPRLFLVVLTAVICLFLLRGVRWLWIAMVALLPISYGLTSIEGGLTARNVALGIVYLTLLLHPATRRFFQRERLETA